MKYKKYTLVFYLEPKKYNETFKKIITLTDLNIKHENGTKNV